MSAEVGILGVECLFLARSPPIHSDELTLDCTRPLVVRPAPRNLSCSSLATTEGRNVTTPPVPAPPPCTDPIDDPGVKSGAEADVGMGLVWSENCSCRWMGERPGAVGGFRWAGLVAAEADAVGDTCSGAVGWLGSVSDCCLYASSELSSCGMVDASSLPASVRCFSRILFRSSLDIEKRVSALSPVPSPGSFPSARYLSSLCMS
mmetsp:Transcript_28729/g.71694  ORF Transcript_28729/g.71694 Transcript_28729/m.71694 type:complete len:205 (-) Transcript_28729:245-859(-)